MIRVIATEQGGDIAFKVEFDSPDDAEATMRGEGVQVAITPAVPLTDEVRQWLSDLIGSAAQQYVGDRAH